MFGSAKLAYVIAFSLSCEPIPKLTLAPLPLLAPPSNSDSHSAPASRDTPPFRSMKSTTKSARSQ